MSLERPTKKQRELLSYLEAFIGSNGYGPSYREIMRALNYKSISTVAVHVDNLIKKGLLRKRDKTARSLEVVKSDGSTPEVPPPVVRTSDSKWLVEQVGSHFDRAESNPAIAKKEADNLYVLVGALQVLGFEDAARAFKARLLALVKE